MPRHKTLSDADVLAKTRRLHAEGGDKAVSFGTVARASGLAASTLAQRYGSVAGMLAAAARDGWAGLIGATAAAEAEAADKGPQGFLKALDNAAREAPMLLALGARDAAAAEAAAQWRGAVEAALARRLGNGERARQSAQALFALWQGQVLWGGSEVKIKDIARRLA
ncbi:transcriptional regulator [Rhodobacter sp. Har01]|uniref:transcriptional regulator n=1 Tax=Rhodobacter sp. Har01 TaxID=2883999 RepID=UPI001D064DDB|nr:transcriptional regulator [Rhodobacter sp. Har01]MCB6177677.1 transcriptional regulator [Rhodobacter sp. Har01]